MKKLLLISYYWPPAGGGGVQRWLKMSKYLPENGWLPVVYTALPTTYVAKDRDLLDEVHPDIEIIRTPIAEPYGLYAKLMGQKKEKSNYSGFIKDKKSGLAHKISVFIRSNLFIPDARKFWIRPSVKYLRTWLKDNHVDAIVTNGPPHSMHMIGLKLKKHFPNIPWIADFRDPWTNIDFYKDLELLPFSDSLHKRMEKSVLEKADKVVTVTWTLQKELSALGNGRKIDLVLNGYDPFDFKNFMPIKTDEFIICHLGSMNKDRNPTKLWKALQSLKVMDEEFAKKLKIYLIGPVDNAIKQSINQYKLEENLVLQNFIPHHEAIQFLQKCDLLLLSINQSNNSKGILPGKLFEYLATSKPILAIGPKDGDINKVMTKLSISQLFDYEEYDLIKEFIQKAYNYSSTGVDNIEKYSRKSHAKSYALLLNELV